VGALQAPASRATTAAQTAWFRIPNSLFLALTDARAALLSRRTMRKDEHYCMVVERLARVPRSSLGVLTGTALAPPCNEQ
jgi:hypothetical protein